MEPPELPLDLEFSVDVNELMPLIAAYQGVAMNIQRSVALAAHDYLVMRTMEGTVRTVKLKGVTYAVTIQDGVLTYQPA